MVDRERIHEERRNGLWHNCSGEDTVNDLCLDNELVRCTFNHRILAKDFVLVAIILILMGQRNVQVNIVERTPML